MITKKLFRTTLIIGLLAFNPIQSNAQFWKKVTKRLQNKAENKTLDKIDQKADKAMDKALDDKPNKTKKKGKDTFEFKGSVTVEASNETNETAKFNLLFHKDAEVFCMEMKVDKTNQIYNVITPSKVISFMDVSGMKIKKENNTLEFDNTDKVPTEHGEFSKSGKTKEILGYECHEYIYSNDEGEASIWITKKFPIKSKYAPLLGMTKDTKLKGFILELNYTSNDGEKANIKVVNIEKDKKVKIKSNDYKSMF
ncbi:DUF4412 domain-containing protein [Tenacibaculum sp. 190524A05c]|uniref:DUF4412 domain-containing protein n=1 Tax=Tenacibaculum platacis TaxID=3137852 RepID=UPI0032B29370